MVIRITFKRLVLILLTFIVGLNVYLCETNYWFDRKLEKLANPLLKQVMQEGYYRIDKNKFCPFEAVQVHLDVDDLLTKLLEAKSKIVVTGIAMKEFPSTFLRMNGNHEIDRVFNNDQEIPCDTERRYKSYQATSEFFRNILFKNPHSRMYVFYDKKECLNCNVFFDNLKLYQNNLFGILKVNSNYISDGRSWIIKHKNYYYLIAELNGQQAHAVHKARERHLVFKKLTLEQLMYYDNGSYWKLIKDYNIKID